MNTPTVPDGQTPPPVPPSTAIPRYGDYDVTATMASSAPRPIPPLNPTRSRILRATRSPTRSICRRWISTHRCRRPCHPRRMRATGAAERATRCGSSASARSTGDRGARYPSDQPAAPAARHLRRRLWRPGDLLQRQPVVVPAALRPARHAGRAAGLPALYHPGADHSATRPLNMTRGHIAMTACAKCAAGCPRRSTHVRIGR